MTVSEQKIGGYNQSNVPFVLSLHLVNRKDVIAVLDPVRHKLPDAVAMRVPIGGVRIRTGAKLYKFMFPPLTCGFTQESSRGDGGVQYAVGVSFPMPASRIDLSEWFNDNAESQFVALMADANGQAYIVGNEDRGLRPLLGQVIGSINDQSVTLSGNFNVPAFILPSDGAGVVLANLFPETDFSLDFSLDFNA